MLTCEEALPNPIHLAPPLWASHCLHFLPSSSVVLQLSLLSILPPSLLPSLPPSLLPSLPPSLLPSSLLLACYRFFRNASLEDSLEKTETVTQSGMTTSATWISKVLTSLWSTALPDYLSLPPPYFIGIYRSCRREDIVRFKIYHLELTTRVLQEASQKVRAYSTVYKGRMRVH